MPTEDMRVSLETKVYNYLEEKILTGEYPKGMQIVENNVCKETGVSRTPIREALHMLEKDGLVRLVQNKGAVVIGVSTQDLIDIYKIRMRIEGLAARMAAENMSDKEKEELNEIVELSEFYITKRDAADKLKELDTSFHKIIYKASGSRMIYNTLSEYHKYIKAYRKLSLSVKGRFEKSISEHREILDAILNGDAENADALMSKHVGLALENVLNAIELNNK